MNDTKTICTPLMREDRQGIEIYVEPKQQHSKHIAGQANEAHCEYDTVILAGA